MAYSSDIRFASQLFRTGNIFHLSNLLDRHLPAEGVEDRREFAWYYLHQFSQHLLTASLPAQKPSRFLLLSFSRDGRLLMTAGPQDSGLVQVWDMQQGSSRLTSHCATVLRKARKDTQLAAFYADGSALAIVPPSERVVRLLDVETGREKGALQHPTRPDYQALSADAKTLITVAAGQVRLWDTHSLQLRGSPINTEANVSALASSPNAQTLALVSATNPGQLQLWDLSSGAVIRELNFDSEIHSLSYSPRGDLLAVWQADSQIALFCMDRNRLVECWRAEQMDPSAIAFSPDSRWLALGSGDGVVLYNLSERTIRNRLRWQASKISTLAFSSDGPTLAVGTEDGHLYRLNPDCPPAHDTLRGGLRPAAHPVLSHDGKTLAVPDEDQSVKLLDVATGEIRRTLPMTQTL